VNPELSPCVKWSLHANRDWNWNGFPEGELQSLKANGGDGTLKPAFRIWEEKVKPCGGLAARQ
jgi:hypothetical protein